MCADYLVCPCQAQTEHIGLENDYNKLKKLCDGTILHLFSLSLVSGFNLANRKVQDAEHAQWRSFQVIHICYSH